MNRLILISLLSFISISSWSQDDNQLYDHDLDANKWEKLRDGVRYEGRDGPKSGGAGQRWTYPSNEEYDQAVEQYGSGQNGSGSGSGNGSGSGSGSNDYSSGGNNAGDGAQDYPQRSSQPRNRSSSSSVSATGLGAFGYVLLAIFVGGLIFLIFYLWVKSPKDGKKITEEIILEDVNPIEIPLTELQKLLQEAVAKGDYRGAVRIYFIFIVRDLTQKGHIQWEKEKTNFHYLREMSGKNEYDDFNRSVSYFEIIWYGKREIDASKFEQVKPNFTLFLDKLGVK